MPYHHGDLHRAAVEASRELLDRKGFRGFALSEVAGQLGVSTTALYRHFADKETLLVTLATDAFALFASRLARSASRARTNPVRAMTVAYLAFATTFPQRYELMFNARLDQSKHPLLEEAADGAFFVLARALHEVDPTSSVDEIEVRAFKIWATCHGWASLRAGGALDLSSLRIQALALASVEAISTA